MRDDSRPRRLERANQATCFAPVAPSQDPVALLLETTPSPTKVITVTKPSKLCRCRMRWPLGTRLVINGVEKELARNNHGVLQWEIYYP